MDATRPAQPALPRAAARLAFARLASGDANAVIEAASEDASARSDVTWQHHRGAWTDVGSPERLAALDEGLRARTPL